MERLADWEREELLALRKLVKIQAELIKQYELTLQKLGVPVSNSTSNLELYIPKLDYEQVESIK